MSSSYWDAVAPRYDRNSLLLERRWMAPSRRWVGARARGRTLEIAVGTGANLPYYPPGLALTGIDFSPKMLAQAAAKVHQAKLTVGLQVGDAQALPFAAESFETVVSTFAMCGVPSVQQTLREAIRVLQPGGRLLLADHVISTAAPVRLLQRVADRLTQKYGEYWTRRPLPILRELGLTIVESERDTFGIIERVHVRRD